jgi:hypothetical protein
MIWHRYAAAADVVVEPHCLRDTAAVLSGRVLIECSRMSYLEARTRAICSKSKLMSVPIVLLLLMSWAEIMGGKGSHHSSGASLGLGEIHMLPMPSRKRPQYPRRLGASPLFRPTVSVNCPGQKRSNGCHLAGRGWRWTNGGGRMGGGS